jgi:hypothetical protein
MKKVDLKAKCDEYSKDTRDFPSEINACCATCYYVLFAHCFLEEFKAGDRLVHGALEGWDEEAKRTILRRIEKP